MEENENEHEHHRDAEVFGEELFTFIHKLLTAVFDFTEEILRVQRDFAGQLMDQTRSTARHVAAAAPKAGGQSGTGRSPTSRTKAA